MRETLEFSMNDLSIVAFVALKMVFSFCIHVLMDVAAGGHKGRVLPPYYVVGCTARCETSIVRVYVFFKTVKFSVMDIKFS